jgi:hypothetical protein
MKKRKVLFCLLGVIAAFSSPADAMTIQHYTIDSSTSKIFNPLAIPRFQIAPLSDSGQVAFYLSGFPSKEAFRVTYNLDSAVRWVAHNMGALSDLDHSHITVYNDTIYQGRSSDNRLYAFSMIDDSLTTLFTYDWGLPESELYIASAIRLPGSDTVISVSRGYNDDNAVLYWISENKGVSFDNGTYLVRRDGTGRCRIGTLYCDNTIAAIIDSADNSIGWYTWDRGNRRWQSEGRAFNRSMFRGFAGNIMQDSIRFLVSTRDFRDGDSVIWAYKSRGASQWTEGEAFQSSIGDQDYPPYLALTYIEASDRLVLFYNQSRFPTVDSFDIYMRYFDKETWNWSSPKKISRGRHSWKVTTAQIVPASHGDVCYAMYPMDSTIGGTVYHFADVVKITFDGAPPNNPPLLNDIGAKSINEGQSLSFVVSAYDADGTLLTLGAAPLPAGASFVPQANNTGRFSWIPSFSQAGSYNVTFYVSDGIDIDSELVVITVNNVNRPPVLSSIGSLSVRENEEIRIDVSATDPDGTIPTLSSSALPRGASFSSSSGTGSFAWTPNFEQAGTYNLTFYASDGALIDSERVAIAVTDVNRPPVLAPIGPLFVMEGANLDITVAASDPDGTIPVLSLSPVPPGASFTNSGGLGYLDWTPNYEQAGLYYVTFYASDNVSLDSERVVITVDDSQGDIIPPAPITDLAVTNGPLPGQVILTWTATGDDGTEGQAHHYVVKTGNFYIYSEIRWLRADTCPNPPVPPLPGELVSFTVEDLTSSLPYCFVLKAYDEANNASSMSNAVVISVDDGVVASSGDFDDPFNIFPNPSNSAVKISYTLEAPSEVSLTVYNILGQKVASLVNDWRKAGEHAVLWDGRGDDGAPVASGIYFCKLHSGGKSEVKRIMMLK